MQQELIATLWLQLTDAYGSRFVNQYGDRDSGVWYQALRDLREEDILFGLDAMLRDPRFETWPPNCTQLRHLCIKKPGLGNAPSVGRAFEEARHNLSFAKPRQWSHPAVKFTVKYVGFTDICDGDKVRAFAKFSACYEQVLARIAAGKSLPEVRDEELVIPVVRTKPAPRLSLELKNKPGAEVSS